MDDSKLNELFTEFRKKYPKMDYFTQEEIFQLARMGFHLGYDERYSSNGVKRRPVIRGDGKPYISVGDAARKNKVPQSTLIRAIKKRWKCGGYNWKYKN